ncbi:MAG TPA: indole-3-glycerol-phosphate synthase [Methanomassiliicoccales archaeon]|nr:indole-3-glycerol-phosphate synthase [Methanomassiliicoccales archaeon]
MLRGVEDRLSLLVRNARELVDCGFYSHRSTRYGRDQNCIRPSLVKEVKDRPNFPIVAEVKLASPTAGRLGTHLAEELIDDYRQGGAAALSVLTEPRFFLGSLRYLELAARTGLPVMMKDFIIDQVQIETASRLGASAVLLIEGIFDRELATGRDALIDKAHETGMEVVLEASTLTELEGAIGSKADILAFNQRDLRTFRQGPNDTGPALSVIGRDGRPAMVMSMMNGKEDVRRMRDMGASCVLIGSALSGSPCPRDKLSSMRMVR